MTSIFSRRGGSGPIKAPLSMRARILMELQRNGLGHPEYPRGNLPAEGIRFFAAEPPPLTSVSGVFFRLTCHPTHLAGHYPHSRKTPEHIIEVDNDELLGKVCGIFKRWPRVSVRCASAPL